MSKLLNPERGPFTDVVVFDYQDMQRLGTGNTLQIGVLPPGSALALAAAIKTVAFSGTTTTVINVGTTIGDPDEYLDALNISTATLNLPTFNTGDAMLQAAGNTTVLGGYRPITPVAVATPIYVKLTDAAIASATAGEFIVGFAIVDLLQYNVK